MRSLHRDIGFFSIGLIFIFSLSGLVLIYRDTGFLRYERHHEKVLSPNLELSEVGNAIYFRNLEISSTEGEVIFFQNGSYNQETGVVKYTTKEFPDWIKRLNRLHTSASKKFTHWFSTTLAVMLLFLAISSFWMLKPKSKLFRRGIILAVTGILASIIVLLFIVL